MREFKTYNPIVNFIYFLSAIGFSMFMMHPVFLIISLVCAIICTVMESGVKKALKSLLMLLPFVILMGAINPLFNHKGATILAYFPNGNPFTAESVCYGIGASIMLLAVFLLFSCYNKVVTSDKFIYIFGNIFPTLSLVFSMTIRFIPKLGRQAREIINAQKALGRDVSKGNIIVRCKRWAKVISILITRSLESSVETSDSMRSRGYGIGKRTAYSIYRFDKRDAVALLWIVINSVIVIIGMCTDSVYYTYFPSLTITAAAESAVFEVSYLLLMLTPAIIEVKEACRWKALK